MFQTRTLFITHIVIYLQDDSEQIENSYIFITRPFRNIFTKYQVVGSSAFVFTVVFTEFPRRGFNIAAIAVLQLFSRDFVSFAIFCPFYEYFTMFEIIYISYIQPIILLLKMGSYHDYLQHNETIPHLKCCKNLQYRYIRDITTYPLSKVIKQVFLTKYQILGLTPFRGAKVGPTLQILHRQK